MKVKITYDKAKELVYLGLGLVLLIVAYRFFTMSVDYMGRALVATSALSALIGFTSLVASLQLFRLSAIAKSLHEGNKE